jgi:hypothetical protein
MPEAGRRGGLPAGGEEPVARTREAEPPDDEAVAAAGPARGRADWLLYGLGLGLQTFLWFLLFLAIAIAVMVGSELTEFRYVGF